jgi:hypothetical protein
MMRLFIKYESNKSDPNELKELLSECGKIKHFEVSEGSGYMVKSSLISRNMRLQMKQKTQ